MESVESTELEGGAIPDENESSDILDIESIIVDSTEDMQDSVYVDSTELIGDGVTTVPEQGTTTVVVTASEEVDTFDNSGFEIAAIFLLGLIIGLMVWNTLSRRWQV